jgi:hypothetical protein
VLDGAAVDIGVVDVAVLDDTVEDTGVEVEEEEAAVEVLEALLMALQASYKSSLFPAPQNSDELPVHSMLQSPWLAASAPPLEIALPQSVKQLGTVGIVQIIRTDLTALLGEFNAGIDEIGSLTGGGASRHAHILSSSWHGHSCCERAAPIAFSAFIVSSAIHNIPFKSAKE